MFTTQTSLVCALLWTLGRTELLEPLEPNSNGTLFYSNNLLVGPTPLAMKSNQTTGGQYSGITFHSFSSRGRVLLELGTQDDDDQKIDTHDPQALSYLNSNNACENSVYWYPTRLNGKQRRKVRKLYKRSKLAIPSKIQILALLIWDILALRSAYNFANFGLFPIQLVLHSILLASTFWLSYSPSTSTPAPTPAEERKLPVQVCSTNSAPSLICL
jgi:hypothetical protein